MKTGIQQSILPLALLVGALIAPASATAADEPLTAAEAREIAKEAFYWGMHPVSLYHLRYNFVQNEKSPKLVGVNRLGWDRSPMKALPRIATTPNATTLYGVGFLDLSKEPAVVTVAEVKGPLLERPVPRQLRPLVAHDRQPVRPARPGPAPVDRPELEW